MLEAEQVAESKKVMGEKCLNTLSLFQSLGGACIKVQYLRKVTFYVAL